MTTLRRMVFAASAVSLSLAACEGQLLTDGSDGSGGFTPPEEVRERLGSDVALTLEPAFRDLSYGQAFDPSVRIDNTGLEPFRIELSGCAFFLRIHDPAAPGADPIWSSEDANEGCPDTLYRVWLNPGESWSRSLSSHYVHKLLGDNPPGTYSVRAVVNVVTPEKMQIGEFDLGTVELPAAASS